MGLTTEYQRFVPGAVFGVIGNNSGNVLLFKKRGDESSNFIAVGACEDVLIWNCRSRLKEFELRGDKYAVTTIAQNARATHLAAGYTNGMIRIFNLSTRECEVTFSGHRRSVSCLAFDTDGFRVASGGMDTEIVIWDVIEQAGLNRLKGHTGAVTQCHFLKQKNVLVSCSKDSLVKFWALDMQHCFRTLVADGSEICDLLLLRDSQMFVASKDKNIFVYKVGSWDDDDDDEPVTASQKKLRTDEENACVSHRNVIENFIRVADYGQIVIKDHKKRLSFAVDRNERIFGYHTYRKTVNLFKILNAEEAQKKMKRERKKAKKLLKAEESEIEIPVTIDREIDELEPLTFPCNIVSFACDVERGDIAKFVILFQNNSISLYTLDIGSRSADKTLLASISHPGHRTTIKTLDFSSDSVTLLSGSDECVKIWNQNSQKCICTLQCESALCSAFTAGNRHCIIGSKSGKLHIFDIGAGASLESIDAHNGSVQCLCLTPDQCGIVTGGSDKDVKFWNLELIKDENYSSTKKRLSLSLQRTLKMPAEVLCVKYSPNYKLLAVSLSDWEVKVLFADTLKLAFDLYSHKFPVTSIDISSDSMLIVTGSDDRNVKIWNTEFGSCNKSLFAHDDGITSVKFLPKTHLFFTAGKDKKIKQWDADNFQKIITLEGHQNSIDALAVSPDGMIVLSAARDRSVRMWKKSDEPLILEEEQEREREMELDKAMLEEEERDSALPGEGRIGASLPCKKTVECVKAVDQLMEAIDAYSEETHKLDEYENQCKLADKRLPPITPHPLFAACSADSPKHYMLLMMRRIKTKDLEQTLLLLPFHYAVQLLEILADIVESKWDTERSCKCVVFLLKIHFTRLTTCRRLYPLYERLQHVTQREAYALQDLASFALVGLRCVQRLIDEEQKPQFIDTTKRTVKKKKKSLPILKSV